MFSFGVLRLIVAVTSFVYNRVYFAQKLTFRLHSVIKSIDEEQKVRCVIATEKVNGGSDGEKTSFRNMA